MVKTKILVLGITSFTGYRFFKLNNSYDVYGICRRWPGQKNEKIYELNELSLPKIIEIIKQVSTILINCLSLSNVDECENNYTTAMEINYELAIEIMKAGEMYNYKAVSFSSSLIYAGSDTSYNEYAEAKPLNKYGEIKLLSDNYFREHNQDKHLMLRPTTIYGIREKFQRDNPANFILQSLNRCDNIYLVDDVETILLYLDDFVQILNSLIDKDAFGEYNVGGNETLSRYSLGLKIVSLLNKSNSLIHRVDSKHFNTIAKRPKRVILDTSKVFQKTQLSITKTSNALKEIISEARIK